MKSEKKFIFRFIASFLLPIMHALGRYHYVGSANVPKSGAFVLAPNHYSNLDPLVIAVALYKHNRVPRFLGKASLFRKPVIGWLLRKAEQIPVERTGTSRTHDPLAVARNVVAEGYAVVIYPEGTLTRQPDYWPMRGKYGAVRMALDADIPLIPAASWGAQQILPRYSNRISLFPRKNVTTRFGTPVDLSEFAGKPVDSRVLAKATERLMDAITAELEELRGEPAPAERWNPAANGQSEVGRF
ncbi:MAG: 1-acyl-sn-glycerol-3-phosphate acyltransferase [Salinibacterium sp.]|nr:1-acyl-sn-glycerol-3-phosphate acyltransferase [Salinibacterium sp.]